MSGIREWEMHAEGEREWSEKARQPKVMAHEKTESLFSESLRRGRGEHMICKDSS